MTKAKKGSAYMCDVCGTTLLVTEEGIGILEDIVCCGTPMLCEFPTQKKTKRKAKKKSRKKK